MSLPGVWWLLCGSSSLYHGVVCSLWLWYFQIILTIHKNLSFHESLPGGLHHGYWFQRTKFYCFCRADHFIIKRGKIIRRTECSFKKAFCQINWNHSNLLNKMTTRFWIEIKYRKKNPELECLSQIQNDLYCQIYHNHSSVSSSKIADRPKNSMDHGPL